MQAVRPFLRSCQRSSLGRVAGPLQHLNAPAVQIRAQHNDQGQHREYFQSPGSEPKPDLTPYSRPNQRQRGQRQQSHYAPQTQPAVQSNTASATTTPLPAREVRWPRSVIRLIRGSFWLLASLSVGAAAGLAWVTYEYLQPPFEPGSAEEQELVEDILDALDSYPAVDSLREQGWHEVSAFTPDFSKGVKSKNLVHQVLGRNNPQGVFMRVFHHPEQEATMIVAFMGFGIEGVPEIVHTGAVISVLHEAVNKHMDYYYPGQHIGPVSQTEIEYQVECRPGEIYTMLVIPFKKMFFYPGNKHVEQLGLSALLAQFMSAPVMGVHYDAETKSQSRSLGINAKYPSHPINATCRAHVEIRHEQGPTALDAKAFQVGGKNDEGLNKILNAIADNPSYQNWLAGSSKEEKKDDGKE